MPHACNTGVPSDFRNWPATCSPFARSAGGSPLPCLRYLKENMSHGSAGGLHHFKNVLLEDDPVRVHSLSPLGTTRPTLKLCLTLSLPQA